MLLATPYWVNYWKDRFMVKKISLIFVFIMMMTFSHSESLRAYQPARTLSMGTSFITDSSTFDGFFSNPALLGYMEDKSLITGLDIRLGTNKWPELSGFVKKVIDDSDSVKDISAWMPLLGVALDVDIGGPFLFGMVKNHFAWSLTHVSYGTVSLASISNFKLFAGEDISLDFGYGREIFDIDGHSLALGGTARFFMLNRVSAAIDLQDISADFADNLAGLLRTDLGFGFGFDMGVIYRFRDFLSLGIAWKDAASPYGLKNMANDDKTQGLLDNNLTVGVGLHIPVDWSRGVITKWNIMADYTNIVQAFDKNYRNPWLNLAVGTELQLFKFLFLRTGIGEMYWHAGVGLGIKMFKIDFAAFGRELGGEPGAMSQFNMALSFRFAH